MGVTPFNELFTTYENMQTKAEIEEELVKFQEFQEMKPTILATRFIPPSLYTQGYIDALKWVLRDGKEKK